MLAGMDFEIQRGYAFSFTVPAFSGAVVLFVGDGGTKSVNADASGAIELSAAETADMPAGEWRWEASADLDGKPCLLRSGRAVVKRTLRADGEAATETTANERILANAEAALEELSKGADNSVSVDGTNYSWETRDELLMFVARMRRLVEKERQQERVGYRDTGILKFTPRRGRGTWRP